MKLDISRFQPTLNQKIPIGIHYAHHGNFGSGLSDLAAADLLSGKYDRYLLKKMIVLAACRYGGHANMVDVTTPDRGTDAHDDATGYR